MAWHVPSACIKRDGERSYRVRATTYTNQSWTEVYAKTLIVVRAGPTRPRYMQWRRDNRVRKRFSCTAAAIRRPLPARLRKPLP